MSSKRGFLLIAIVLVIASVSLVYASIFTDSSASNFNNGTYANTTYNGSAVVLSGSNLSGTYTSRIFNDSSTSDWRAINFSYNNYNSISLIAGDSDADIWKSLDDGINWNLIKDDFNNGDGNGATDMDSNSTTSFLVYNQILWSSINKGISWTKINDNYNGAEGQNAGSLVIDKNNYLYIIEGDQDVWRSTNGGVNFTKLISNFNGGNGVVVGLAVNNSNVLFAVDVSAGFWSSADNGTTWNLVNDDFNGAIGNSADDIIISQNNTFYILDRQDFWRSTNNGINWTLTNTDINGGGDSNDGLVAHIDFNNNIYVIDGSEDILHSNDSGVSFTKIVSNFNGANANSLGLTSVIENTNLSFQVRNCSSSNCADGSFVGPDGTANSYYTNLTNSLNLRSKYFQYKAYFNSDITNLTSQLNNVVIDYSLFDIINPNLTIVSPQNISYNNSTLLVNISASDNNAISSVWFYNGSANVTYNSPVLVSFSQGSNTLIAYANDSVGNLNTTSRIFVVDSVAPSINIIHPQAIYYGFNNSLPLNFTISDSVSGVNLTSCVYSFNSGLTNISLTNCQNTTFSVAGGITQYNLTLFAKDILNNWAYSNVSFNVNTDAPVINLQSPLNNSYLNYTQNIYFNYSVVSGIGVSSCYLYGDFNNSWSVNKTNNSLASGNNFFVLNLSEGSYNWGIACNDTQNRFFQRNDSFSVDVTKPNILLTQPSGTKSSRTGIPLTFSINDSSPISCKYNVFRGATQEIANTSIDCSSSSETFSVTLDADFTLNFFVNDSAGNYNSSSSNFTVSTTSSSSTPSSGSSGGGGGGGGGSFAGIISGNLELTNVNDFIAEPGENRRISLPVRNAGLSFLNDCRLQPYGTNADWIIPVSETVKIGGGEAHEFYFNLQLPENLDAGEYKLSLSVKCNEQTRDAGFSVEILDKKIDFELLNSSKSRSGEVSLNYLLKEMSNLDQDVNIQFILYNSANEKVAEVTEEVSLKANSQKTFETILPISSSLSGDFNLLININSETYSTFIQEDIVLGPGLSGFSILNNGNAPTIIFFILGVFFLVFVGFMLTRISTLKKKLKKTTDYSNAPDYFTKMSINFNLFKKKIKNKLGLHYDENFPSGEKSLNKL